MSKYLLNTKTGVVLDHTELLAKLDEMVPCDAHGHRIAPEVMPPVMPAVVDYTEDSPPPTVGQEPPVPPSVPETVTPSAQPQAKGAPRGDEEVRPEDVKRCVAAIARMVDGKATKLKEGARLWTRPNHDDKGKPWAESLALEAGVANMTPELRDAAWAAYREQAA